MSKKCVEKNGSQKWKNVNALIKREPTKKNESISSSLFLSNIQPFLRWWTSKKQPIVDVHLWNTPNTIKSQVCPKWMWKKSFKKPTSRTAQKTTMSEFYRVFFVTHNRIFRASMTSHNIHIAFNKADWLIIAHVSGNRILFGMKENTKITATTKLCNHVEFWYFPLYMWFFVQYGYHIFRL